MLIQNNNQSYFMQNYGSLIEQAWQNRELLKENPIQDIDGTVVAIDLSELALPEFLDEFDSG
jgi:hypothetical protein